MRLPVLSPRLPNSRVWGVMISNSRLTIQKADAAKAGLACTIEQKLGPGALRWYVGQVSGNDIVVEATTLTNPLGALQPVQTMSRFPGKTAILSVVPTGVGCAIGGYAGDAAPVTNLLATAADYLITNPNAVNASNFVGIDSDRVLYTDGYAIDLFIKGQVDLHLPYSNRVGLIVEKASDRELDIIFNIVNAVRAVHGVDIVDVIVTERPIGGRSIENGSGAIVGAIDNPEILLEAVEKLIERGADAIAVTSHLCDISLDAYVRHFSGEYPNPVGGVEAVISYLIAARFGIPCAHAPLLNFKEMDLRDIVVDARGAGEMGSDSGLACVLIGLKRAPRTNAKTQARFRDIINFRNLIAVVAPAGCLGGIPALWAEHLGIPVVAVEQNRTVLDVCQQKLDLRGVIPARTYAEAVGIIMALKAGISLESISRPLKTLRPQRSRHEEALAAERIRISSIVPATPSNEISTSELTSTGD
jgi:hypothetical protein